MTFTLHVDGPRWRTHTEQVRDEVRHAVGADIAGPPLGDVVPVAKGNGYGFGLSRLADQAQRLGLARLAVGSPYEAASVAGYFAGEIVVLQPWDPRDTTASQAWASITNSGFAHRVVRTIASVEALHALATDIARVSPLPPRVVIEGLTSTRRFGLGEPDLDALLADEAVRNALRTGRIDLQGLALHLPLTQPLAPHVATLDRQWHDASPMPRLPVNATGRTREAWAWTLTWFRALSALEAAGCPLTPDATSIWVSHLDDKELVELRAAVVGVALRVRIGTRMWHGDLGALTARGTIMAVHQVAKGRGVGYRQRRAPHDGLLVVVGGGTSHGVALQAPSPVASLRQRAVAAVTGMLEATGRARSPFLWAGKYRWFAETPHMHLSMLWLGEDDVREAVSRGGRVPAVGDELECRVRHSTANFDRIIGLD